MSLSAIWEKFTKQYRSEQVYWYFPQGGTADTLEFREKFRIFQSFGTEPWTPMLQRKVGDALRAAKLSDAKGDDLPRMLKRVFENMGLCWVAENEPIRLTPSGYTYLAETGRSEILNQQVWRYQLPNPVNASDSTEAITLFPHPFLVEVLLASDGYLTGKEFVLFVSQAREESDLRKTIDWIKAWRALLPKAQTEVLSRLSRSRYQTIDQNRSYSVAFHHCDLLLDRACGGLSVNQENVEALERRLAQHKGSSVVIDFKNKPDCISFYGDIEKKPTQIDALEYYIDRSDVEKAVEIYAELPPEVRGGMTVEEFERSQFLERDLEDYLEKNLEQIEIGLSWLGRQHSTTVGPVDLFARAKNGDLVVIELKKGRAADKVFGQVCRYMGCIKSEYAKNGEAVRGVIVGREVDTKLRYATKAVPDGLVTLAVFEVKEAAGEERWIQVAPV